MRTSALVAIVAGVIVGLYFFTPENLPMSTFDQISGNVAISEDEFQDQFVDFMSKYGISYNALGEYEFRYKIFKENYQQIINHNKDEEEHGYTLGVNKFADITLNEFKEKSLGLRAFPRSDSKSKRSMSSTERELRYSELRDEIDWRTEGDYVNPVKDQGTCGSCWAFSTISSVESAFAIKRGSLPNLSEQQLITCTKGYGNGGCSGGWMEYAFTYAETYALCTTEQMPYLGRDSIGCEHTQCLDNDFKLGGFEDVEKEQKVELYTALNEQPVSVAVCAGSTAWQFYKKGVITRFCGKCLDHAVLAVGYGHDKKKGDYVTIRNSWGEGWGEDGYVRISSKDETGIGTCGIYQLPSRPFVVA
ncbi:unnamed protein product [Moneuplotes crassus]|uniref:Uncharacterized protein n=1 Tax=Euplotes crassus TaxID=5936 RepID=A0AAD2CXZ6_EUPCR|nr:unnamed protein product [Moneuplotes crassus]